MPKNPTVSPRKILAENLRALLKAHKMTGPQVASKAGVDRKTVNNMLMERFDPSLENVGAVGRVFGLSAWQLVRPNLGRDLPIGSQIDELIARFYDASPEHRETIIQVAELVPPSPPQPSHPASR